MGEQAHARESKRRLTLGRTAYALLGSLLLALPIGHAVHAQSPHCDADLNPASSNPLGYRLRGDRCERVYIQEVAATVLRLVSLTESFETFEPTRDRPLIVEWTPPSNQPLHLRAQSLKSRLYYRMDSERPAGSASFEWPLDLVAALGLTRNDLGVLAWTARRLGSAERLVHIPVRIRQRTTPAPEPYRMVLVPGVQVEELFLSVARVDANGQPGPYSIDKMPVGLGYYPAGRAVVVPLRIPSIAGVYRIDVGATLTQGGVSAITAYFAHST